MRRLSLYQLNASLQRILQRILLLNLKCTNLRCIPVLPCVLCHTHYPIHSRVKGTELTTQHVISDPCSPDAFRMDHA